MEFIEIAINSPRERGLLIHKKELIKYIKPSEKRVLYRSIYLYDEDGLKYNTQTGSMKNYFGKRGLDHLIIDIDKEDNTDEFTLHKAKSLLVELGDLGVTHKSIQPYFSGTGYHILLAGSVFNFQASDDLPYVVKETIKKLFPDVDLSIYSRSGLYRVPHSFNDKKCLYKVPISPTELFQLTPDEIKSLAEGPRTDFDYPEIFGEGELEDCVVSHVPKVQEFRKVSEPTKVVPCVQTMLKLGPLKGSRHKTLLRIASHFKRHGIPSEYCKASANHWNNGQMEDAKVAEVVEQTYINNYKYGCKDELMHKFCKSTCIHFRRKDYLVDIKTSDQLQEEYKQRMTTNFDGRVIKMTEMLGLKNVDVDIYPGELVTIFGPTGSNKTAFAQNIALGYDAVNDRIRKEWQIPTLYLSLELSGWYMHRRNLQIVSGKSKDEVNDNYEFLYKANEDKLSHLTLQTISPSLENISTKVRELQPELLIVDYIDLVDTPPTVRGEYEKIKYISHSLSSMAVNEDIIIIQISQTSREYGREDRELDLYAGKGSGAIENASRKVIGIHGQANKVSKKVELFKNTDGELFTKNLQWTPSFRLKEVE
tara:strand:+ start:17133 stop:18908 length:1776 start_codon:yes stop_codon:yes gene_type:complete